MSLAKKALGQHWLDDASVLEAMCEAADLRSDDTVLEIGPGHGSLTKHLLARAGHVVAIELDSQLARQLSKKFSSKGLSVIEDDVLKFDPTSLPPGYKVVASIPYYLTSHLLRVLSESPNPPSKMVLLVQKEVAERLAAAPGQMSLLSVSVQLYFDVKLGRLVPAKLFKPPPKVDSQIVMLARREKPLFESLDSKAFFRVVKAGFSGRRKKLRSSLSAGLGISKQDADEVLKGAGISGDLRAQNLSLQDWHKLYKESFDPKTF